MALLTEQPISSLADWMAYDSKLSILSSQETASVERKAELAQQEIQTELLAFLIRNSNLGDLAVRSLLKQVHISEPIKRWHVYLTLALYYSDLASLQASALHREQSRYLETRSEEARDQAFVTGVGIVSQPVPRGLAPSQVLNGEEDLNRMVRARVKFLDANGLGGSASEEFVVRLTTDGTTVLSFEQFPDPAFGWQLFLAEDQEVFLATQTVPYAPYETVSIASTYGLTAAKLEPEGQLPDRYIHITRSLGR